MIAYSQPIPVHRWQHAHSSCNRCCAATYGPGGAVHTFAVTVNSANTPAVAYCRPFPDAVDFVESVRSPATEVASPKSTAA
jgi:hypothetical protein